MHKKEKTFDVAVIGGGPAGLIASGRAAEMGARVILFEKNAETGRKLLMTGNGRCNLTQGEFDLKELVRKFGKNGRFLFSSLAAFGPRQTIEFFESIGVPVKTEKNGRVFPVSDKSRDILWALQKYLKLNKVEIRYNSEITGFRKEGDVITGLKIQRGSRSASQEEIRTNEYILATGGKSYPATGSTGDGYAWLESLSHTIIPPIPALVPVETKESWVKEAQGLSLKNVEISLWQNGKKRDWRFGEMLFTHFGLSGPIVLDISQMAGQLLAKGEVEISLDLKPELNYEHLDLRLKQDFQLNQKKDLINYLPGILPRKIIPIIIQLTGIDARKKINAVTKDERKKLAIAIKNLRFSLAKTCGFEKAMVTSGGVSLKEVDPKTMRSRKIKNLYLAGEILDLDGPTGGYNLQICWSTGYAAGTHAALAKDE